MMLKESYAFFSSIFIVQTTRIQTSFVGMSHSQFNHTEMAFFVPAWYKSPIQLTLIMTNTFSRRSFALHHFSLRDDCGRDKICNVILCHLKNHNTVSL